MASKVCYKIFRFSYSNFKDVSERFRKLFLGVPEGFEKDFQDVPKEIPWNSEWIVWSFSRFPEKSQPQGALKRCWRFKRILVDFQGSFKGVSDVFYGISRHFEWFQSLSKGFKGASGNCRMVPNKNPRSFKRGLKTFQDVQERVQRVSKLYSKSFRIFQMVSGRFRSVWKWFPKISGRFPENARDDSAGIQGVPRRFRIISGSRAF